MINNKKAQIGIGLFWFFFVLMIASGIIFFFLTALPAILYTYGLETAADANQDLVDMGISTAASQTAINAILDSFNNLYKIADYFFIFIIISMFISSCIASTQAARNGIFSFFGLVTLGNIFLIFIMSYAIHIRDWFLNEIVYSILLISIETPFFNFFFANSYYIGTAWYVILLVINMIDFKSVGQRMPFLSSDENKIKFEE